MEDLIIANNHLSNQSERGKTIKQVHQLYMLKRSHEQVDHYQEVIRDEMANKEESDDSEELFRMIVKNLAMTEKQTKMKKFLQAR